MWVRTLPGKRCFSGFEKSIDDESVALQNGSPGRARSFATDNGRTAIDRDASCVREQYTTAEWNSFRIDRAMSRAQTRTIGTRTYLTFAWPVNGDPSQQRIFGRENRGRE